MLTPYPLTPTLNVIVRDVSENIRARDFEDYEELNLTKFAAWVGSELAVNAKLLDIKEAEEFKHPTLELLYEKSYSMVQEVRYIKHWPCLPGMFPEYKQVTTEITARLQRSQLRLI